MTAKAWCFLLAAIAAAISMWGFVPLAWKPVVQSFRAIDRALFLAPPPARLPDGALGWEPFRAAARWGLSDRPIAEEIRWHAARGWRYRPCGPKEWFGEYHDRFGQYAFVTLTTAGARTFVLYEDGDGLPAAPLLTMDPAPWTGGGYHQRPATVSFSWIGSDGVLTPGFVSIWDGDEGTSQTMAHDADATRAAYGLIGLRLVGSPSFDPLTDALARDTRPVLWGPGGCGVSPRPLGYVVAQIRAWKPDHAILARFVAAARPVHAEWRARR